MAIPAERWNPWVGEKLARGWEAALENLSFTHAKERSELVKIMIVAGPLAEKTAKEMLRIAAQVGVLKVVEPYDAYLKTGPKLKLNSKCDDVVFAKWNERPKVDRWKRARAAARRSANKNSDDYDPMEARENRG